MGSRASQELIGVEEYLAGEKDSEVRHEYVAGHVYAMVGASVYHNRIALALASELRSRLKGRPCDVFLSDMKLRAADAFYYPDVMVCCDTADNDPYTKTRPIFIAEVLSPASRTIDEREKRVAYQCLRCAPCKSICCWSRIERKCASIADKITVGSYCKSALKG
ncbi:MAG: Uma2 family endonuclease [Gammaproteobacteria bacterium]